jgi:MIP family channel proteins
MAATRASEDYRAMEAAEKDVINGAEEHTPPPAVVLPFAIKHKHTRECLSEFLSTFVYCAFGLGVNAQVILSAGAAGNYTSITLAWGVAVMMAMHVGGGVSHSHINPAISIALAVFGVFPWKKVPGYVISQTLGALMGSLMIYTMFYQFIHKADPMQTEKTSVIFHTHPAKGVNHSAAFICETFATMMLLICLLALVDEKNRSTVVPNFPGCVGVLVVGIGMSFSMISSAALNPARDLGPRIMLSMVGYDGIFSANGTYFWIPLVAPTVGAILGCAVYLLFIMGHHPAKVVHHGFF